MPRRREQLILLDDPQFDLNLELPSFHLDLSGNLDLSHFNQPSLQQTSQMSPMDRRGAGSSSSLIGNLDLPHSTPVSQRGYQLPMPFGHGHDNSMGSHKLGNDFMQLADEENLALGEDWGVFVDEDGNVQSAGLDEEPQLPALSQPHLAERALQEDIARLLGSDDVQGVNDQAQLQGLIQSKAATLAGEQQLRNHTDEERDSSSSPKQSKALSRKRRKRLDVVQDPRTTVSIVEFKGWSANYLQRTEQERAGKRQRQHAVTPAQAKKNAFDWVFGRGIGNVGMPINVPRCAQPLAEFFAGDALRNQLLGLAEGGSDQRHGRRRSSSEAELEDAEAGRRVRQRLSLEGKEEQQPGQGEQKQVQAVEVGRDGGPIPPDLPSDVPWNRPGSLIPSSSVKGSVQRGQPGRQLSSPMAGRGSFVPDIERFSDQFVFGSGGAGPLGYSDNLQLPGETPPGPGTSQAMRDALDREGQNFLTYLEAMAQTKGKPKQNDQGARPRQWVSFDDLFEPIDSTRHTAAQAFYHVLQLATKNAIKVEQDSHDGYVAFAEILVGVKTLEIGPD